MQTFLPYSSFSLSMQTLDTARLGNQVYREGMTLLRGNWPHHPAAKMWVGYEDALAAYLWCGCNELRRRGRDYTGRPWHEELRELRHETPLPKLPPWLGNERFHATHRSNLLRKDPEWYSQWGWTESPDLPYFWPTNLKEKVPCIS